MKKIIMILLVFTLIAVCGCEDHGRNRHLPEAKNDKAFTTVGEDKTHKGDGYTLSIPDKNYRYEKDFDDGVMEEKWEYTRKDDVEIKVTTYRNSDEVSARGRFLREHDDYIFEDLTGNSVCGTELDGDTLWFDLHQKGETVYIVSREYPKYTDEALQKELADIAETFAFSE